MGRRREAELLMGQLPVRNCPQKRCLRSSPAAPVTMAGRPEGVVTEELAAGVVVSISCVMR